jgi:phenylalanyl-tRNA synthetase alpha chain
MTSLSPEEVLREVERAAARVATADASTLTDLRTELLGRKAGKLTHVLRSLASRSPEERRELGARANQLKQQIEQAIADREAQLARAALKGPRIDGTMPGRPMWRGAVHPVTAVVDEICDIFRQIGFSRVTGPEAETEEYNFTKLNISLDHPSADMQDTFYLGPKTVLRTHTSPMQARTMERFPPPIRIVVPGQAYRRDAFDPSHAPVFEQIEGLVVDEGVTFVDFKAGIDFFVKKFFAPDTVVRFRPSYFPFTEPSAEVDVQCQICKGAGCTTCKGTGWIEIMGAGMVHPAVFEACGIDAETYTGYAFGMGPHRIALLRYGVPDIRMFFDCDVRFLSQFVDSR